MAVTSTQAYDWSAGIDGDGHFTARVSYRSVTDSLADGPWVVLQAVIAAAPTAYNYGGSEVNANAFPQSIGDATLQERDGSRKVWNTPLVYSTRPLNGPDGSSRPLSPFTTPTAEPWRISGSFVESQFETSIKADGTICLIRGTDEIKTFRIPDGHDSLHLEGASATISLSTRAQSVFKTNSATIWGLSPRMLLLMNWKYEIKRHGTNDYVYHSLDFLINYDLWTELWVNASFKRINDQFNLNLEPPQQRLLPILDKAGMPVHEPHPIDPTTGQPVEAGSETFNTDEMIQEFDFTTLGFPDPLPGPFV